MLTEYGPLVASLAAVLAAVLAYLSSKRRPQIAPEQADKLKSEIANDQAARDRERDAANAKRDRHIVRLENWGFQVVRPWSREAVAVNDEQNALLVKLAAKAGEPYTPHRLEQLPEMPQIDGENT